MTTVAKRDATTLLPIVSRHVRPSTIIYSDEWAAYRPVQQLAPVTRHQTVNHSITQQQAFTLSTLNPIGTISRDMLPSYFDEYVWRERYGQTLQHPKVCAETLLYLIQFKALAHTCFLYPHRSINHYTYPSCTLLF